MPTKEEVEDRVMEAVRAIVSPGEVIKFKPIRAHIAQGGKRTLTEDRFTTALRGLRTRGLIGVRGAAGADGLTTGEFIRLPDEAPALSGDEDADGVDEEGSVDDAGTHAPVADDAELDLKMRAVFAEMEAEFVAGAVKRVAVDFQRACAAWEVIYRHLSFVPFRGKSRQPTRFVNLFRKSHSDQSVREVLAAVQVQDEEFIGLVERYLPALAAYGKDIGRLQAEARLRANPPSWQDVWCPVLKEKFGLSLSDESAALQALTALARQHKMSIGSALFAAKVNNSPLLVTRLIGWLWSKGVEVQGFHRSGPKKKWIAVPPAKEPALPAPAAPAPAEPSSGAGTSPAPPAASAPAEAAAAEGRGRVPPAPARRKMEDDLVRSLGEQVAVGHFASSVAALLRRDARCFWRVMHQGERSPDPKMRAIAALLKAYNP